MSTPRILALDLSLTATGIAYPDGETTTYKPRNHGDQRLHEIAHQIRQIADYDTPTLTIIEDLPTGLRNAAAGSLGMLHGAVRYTLLDGDEHPYLTVPPATLKTYATGLGNAVKATMRMELYKRTGTDNPDEDQVDAAWLRLLALDLMGAPQLDLPKTHRRALDKLTLPVPA